MAVAERFQTRSPLGVTAVGVLVGAVGFGDRAAVLAGGDAGAADGLAWRGCRRCPDATVHLAAVAALATDAGPCHDPRLAPRLDS